MPIKGQPTSTLPGIVAVDVRPAVPLVAADLVPKPAPPPPVPLVVQVPTEQKPVIRRAFSRGRRLHPMSSLRKNLSPPVLAGSTPGAIEVSVILGTVNRPEMLQLCIKAIRASVGKLSYEIVVAYGHHNEPALQWLKEQTDVVPVLGGMSGAIDAFNLAYSTSRGLVICQLNDDVLVEGDSILRAVAHLHAEPKCAAVVFLFDRGDGRGYRHEWLAEEKLHPNQMVARRSTCEAVIAHIGAFWGDAAHRTDKTYGGDSAFGVLCHHLGLRLDSVPGVTCLDREHLDALRTRNRSDISPDHGDRWRKMYLPLLTAPKAPPQPDPHRFTRIQALDPVEGRYPARLDPRRERVLHLHLATPDDPQAGLCRALQGLGDYAQLDWQRARAKGALEREVLQVANRVRPTLVFMQLQTPDIVTPELVAELRPLLAPGGVLLTWCGDVAHKNSPWTVDWQVPLGQTLDLVLHTSLTHVKALRAAGIGGAAYLQIGYDSEQYQPDPRVDKLHDVCFLGNRYYSVDYLRTLKQHDAGLRDAVIEAMSAALGPRFGLYGAGHAGGLGQIPLSEAHTAYQRSKIGLNVSLVNFFEAYSSDRIFRILGCGALLLTKRFPLMSAYGLVHGKNCLVWDTPAEAVELARAYTASSCEMKRAAIAAAGAQLAKQRHTWEHRMGELAALLQAARGTP